MGGCVFKSIFVCATSISLFTVTFQKNQKQAKPCPVSLRVNVSLSHNKTVICVLL